MNGFQRRAYSLKVRAGWCGVWLLAGVALAAGEAASAVGPAGKLDPEAARRRIEALRTEVARHDRLYFQQAAPEIGDREYDRLRRELRFLEDQYPGLVTIPASTPGDDRTGRFPAWRHRMPMLSLEKTYAEGELRAFLAGIAGRRDLAGAGWVVEPKVDGLAVSAVYEKGAFVRAVTRGNGREGEDITVNARCIRNLPARLRRQDADGSVNPIPELIELRGELFMTFAEFDRLNRARRATGEPEYASPRNLAAGTARSLDPAEIDERRLDVVFFAWGACEPATVQPASQRDFHRLARAWGLPVIECCWTGTDTEGVCGAVAALGPRRERLPYPIDGAVVKLDSVVLRARLGETAFAPRWALAFKYEPERATTRLRAITVQVGRTGRLTPVAELEPVSLGGAVVARATLHNGATIARLDLRVGDSVYVEKAGDVIPVITGVDRSRRPAASRPYRFPDHCPACGAAVIRLPGEAEIRCPNAACPAQVRARLRHFASKSCLGIAGLGPVTIDRLVEKGSLRTAADLYRLRPADLVLPGRRPGPAEARVIAAIEWSKHAELWRFIHGLGIPHVGRATARKLARKYPGLGALAAARMEDFRDDPAADRSRIGQAAAEAVVAYFDEPGNRALVAELLELGVAPSRTGRD